MDAPLEAKALRSVTRILEGERASVVLRWDNGDATSFSRSENGDGGCPREEFNEHLRELVDCLMAASYVNAPAAEDAVSHHFAAVIKGTCTSGSMVRKACALLSEGEPPTDEEVTAIAELLVRASLRDPGFWAQQQSASDGGTPGNCHGNTSTGHVAAAAPFSAAISQDWWNPPPAEGAQDANAHLHVGAEGGGSGGCRDDTDCVVAWWARVAGSPHGALCLAALDRFNAQSPLRCLSEDALVGLVRMVGAVLVPDELSLSEAVATVDYKVCGRRVLVRGGCYNVDDTLCVKGGRAVLIQVGLAK